MLRKLSGLPSLLSVLFALRLPAQVLFVDAVKGNDAGSGLPSAPLASLEKAVSLANNFSGKEPITIKIAPGIYVLKNKITVGSEKLAGVPAYSLEAAVMPDDPDWLPAKMPVIQSVSPDNSLPSFPTQRGSWSRPTMWHSRASSSSATLTPR